MHLHTERASVVDMVRTRSVRSSQWVRASARVWHHVWRDGSCVGLRPREAERDSVCVVTARDPHTNGLWRLSGSAAHSQAFRCGAASAL